MRSKLIIIGSLSIAGAVAPMSATAYADNINTHGAICQAFNGAHANDIMHHSYGVTNADTSPREVTCAVPRSPLSLNFLAGDFFVDGHNDPGTSTTCTAYVYDYDGTREGTPVVFTEAAPPAPPGNSAGAKWDHLVLFPPGVVTEFAYVSVVCMLPANEKGVIYGITAIQP